MEGAVCSRVQIKKGKEKQLVRHHPWVFDGAIDSRASLPGKASVVRVEDAAGLFIAYGWYDRESHIPLHLLSWDSGVVPDDSWWVAMIASSLRRRRMFIGNGASGTTACRLAHGEADFLPGLTIDLFGTAVVCMISARVAWDHRQVVVDTVQRLLNPVEIVVATDSAFCGIEHLAEVSERYVGGCVIDAAAAREVRFRENGLFYTVEIGSGQKSGFYCDQRDNRARVAAYARDVDALDAFCYTGGFTLNLLRSGARSVEAVDSSAAVLDRLTAHVALNAQNGRIPVDAPGRVSVIRDDMFHYLRDLKSGRFGLIVLDPPKLARTKAQVEGALRAYKDINRLAIEKVRRDGIVATFSCSGGVSRDMFRTVVAWAAKDAGREVHVLENLGQGPDHPIRLSFPESEYLKGFVLRVL